MNPARSPVPDAADDESVDELVSVVARFGERVVAPRVLDYDRREELPADILTQLGQLGVFGGVIPTAWGGSGLTHVAFARVIEELSRHDHVLGMLASMPTALVGSGILEYGTDEQRDRWLRPLAAGEILGSAALTEAQSGTDAAGILTRYERRGDGYVLDGSKTWISNLELASFFIVFATRDPRERKAGISAFLVPADADGVIRRPFRDKRAFRPMSTGELVLDGVVVGPDSLLGSEGGGWQVAMTAVERGRLAVAAQAIGLARACLDDAVAHARDRVIFGRPLGSFQLTEQKLADAHVGIEASRHLTRSCAELLDAGRPAGLAASVAKLHATETAERVASDAMQLHGAYGAAADLRISRLFNDAKILSIGEGPNEIHRGLIARALLAGPSV